MDNSISTETQIIDRCSACGTKFENADVFCTNCGYPLKGTEQEQKNFLSQRDVDYIDMNTYNKTLKSAGISLYYLAGIFLIAGIFYLVIHKDDPDILATVLSNLILAVIFLVLGAYSKAKPLACIICGLSLYAIVIVLNAMVDPISIVRGIIFKIAIIAYMIKGIKSAIDIEKLKKEHNIA